MFCDHLSDQGSFTLCPPDCELEEEIVYKTGLPVLVPTEALPTPEHHDASLSGSFYFAKIVDAHPISAKN